MTNFSLDVLNPLVLLCGCLLYLKLEFLFELILAICSTFFVGLLKFFKKKKKKNKKKSL